MSEMIKRVATALEQGVCIQCRRPCVGGVTPSDCDKAGCAWDRATPPEQARAAIAAMHEPSNEMVDVGMEARWRSPVRDADSVREIWEAMIECAIADDAGTP